MVLSSPVHGKGAGVLAEVSIALAVGVVRELTLAAGVILRGLRDVLHGGRARGPFTSSPLLSWALCLGLRNPTVDGYS